MKKDFYDVLSIKRNASDEQISTAYVIKIFIKFITICITYLIVEYVLNLIYRFKKLALRHHPLKNPAEMNINLQKFHEICEAYEVLSNCNINCYSNKH